MKIKANSTLIFSLKLFTLLFISSLCHSQVLEIKVATSTIDPSNGARASYSFRIEGMGTYAVASDFTRTTAASTFDYPYKLTYCPDNYLWLTFGMLYLVQTIKSDLYLTSSVFIERNQQERANKFNYNHWFSPPSPSNNTANNAPCTIAGVMTDGLYATPRNSSWLSGFDGSAGSATTPMSVARYCLHKLVNYANWVKIAETGILSQLLAGEGYTMKGS